MLNNKKSTIKKPLKKVCSGIAYQDSRFNTVKVKVKMIKVHPIYLRRYFRFHTYLVHTEKEIKKGEKVSFISTKPMSKKKFWKVIG